MVFWHHAQFCCACSIKNPHSAQLASALVQTDTRSDLHERVLEKVFTQKACSYREACATKYHWLFHWVHCKKTASGQVRAPTGHLEPAIFVQGHPKQIQPRTISPPCESCVWGFRISWPCTSKYRRVQLSCKLSSAGRDSSRVYPNFPDAVFPWQSPADEREARKRCPIEAFFPFTGVTCGETTSPQQEKGSGCALF